MSSVPSGRERDPDGKGAITWSIIEKSDQDGRSFLNTKQGHLGFEPIRQRSTSAMTGATVGVPFIPAAYNIFPTLSKPAHGARESWIAWLVARQLATGSPVQHRALRHPS